MRLRLAFVFAVAVAVGVVACGGAAPAQQFGTPDIEQITQMVRDFAAAYNAKDVEKIGACFAADAAIMPANRSTMRGVEAVKGYYKDRVLVDGATDLAIETQAVEGHGPLAYVAGTFSLTLRPPDGSAGRKDRGKVIWILRKLGGQWKFEWQIMSSDLPPVIPPASSPSA